MSQSPDVISGKGVESYPLTPMQQGMLFDYLADPRAGYDIEQIVCTLPETLDPAAFRRAWELVTARHAVLRTVFRWERLAEPLQSVQPETGLAWQEADWSSESPAGQAAKLKAFLRTDRAAGFDLAHGPNSRLFVAKLGAKSYQCVWTLHHILMDGRAFPLVLNEVFRLYEGLQRGQTDALPAPPLFQAHVDWLQKQNWSASEAYWRAKLKGFSVPTSLRTPRSRTSSVSLTERGELEARLSVEQTATLRSVAEANQVTLNTLVQGAWAILLSRYSGEEDVLFGTIRAGRRSSVAGAENVVGVFINTVPLRLMVPAGEDLGAWLKLVRAQEFELREHEQTPLVKVQKWSPVKSGTRLFDTLLMFDRAELNSAVHRDAATSDRRFELHESINFPLVVQVYAEAGLLVKIQYSRAQFDEDTIERLLGHFQTLLGAMGEGLAREVGSLPLLTAAERKQLLFEWNECRQFPSERCLHELFEAQVTRTPEATALTCDGQSLTYRQLNTQANRLARELQGQGVGPDVLVGICMERSHDLVIGLLAILKAGGAYLPIDLAYPADRLAFMLEDAQAPVLLTQSHLAKVVPSTRARILCVDELLARTMSEGAGENPVAKAGPEHLAYVIYTSGTTGKPKGSMITHRNVTRLFTATNHWYGFNEKDVWTLFHSYAFDFSVWEIWGALLYGGRLVVVPFMVSRSTEAFYQLLASERVTVLNQTPSAFRHLIQAEEAVGQKELALRYVIFGGEALEMQSLRPWFERHGDQRPLLVNMYGITETTVHVTYRPLSAHDIKAASVIGVPIPDLQVYILDGKLQPVPVGIPGEMFVGGAGLARGYLNRPDLTAERFLPDHLSGRPESRLYKTGDLARFLPDRDIEYLGRIDHQVKIRGFRIELGEIESVLCQHVAIREAVVIAKGELQGDKKLIAYLVSPGPAPTVKDLREHLKKKLPEYMVPAAFVFIPKIPLTTNGKVDRKALPEPDQERPDLGSEMVGARNPVEEAVCRIWSEALDVEKIGIHDDFFDLGGHSLTVLKVVPAINDRFGVSLPPVSLFEHRTVAEFCLLLDGKGASPNPAPSKPAEPARVRSGASPVAAILQRHKGHPGTSPQPYRMRESWLAKTILARLYRIPRGRVRAFTQHLILKLEGGDLFSLTMRRLYDEYYGITVGHYTFGGFDVNRVREKTTVGRYSSIDTTVIIRNADHPRNTISTSAIFYHPAFGFAEGYELTRTRVEIGHDVFIGHNAMILFPTRKIGNGAVIAAGSVVVEDVPPYAVVGGYPARVLRYRFSRETIKELEESRWWDATLEDLASVKAEFAKPLEGDEIR